MDTIDDNNAMFDLLAAISQGNMDLLHCQMLWNMHFGQWCLCDRDKG